MEIKLQDVSTDNLTNINITFTKGINSVIGRNSEIKDLFNLICGIKKANNGTIKNSEDIIHLKNKEIHTKDIFYLKGNYNDVLFNINIKEDIKFYLGEHNAQKLNELLSSFNLDKEILNRVYAELSSSEIKKILLIIGLLSNCKLIVIENPTSKLDNIAINSLIKQLKRLKKQDKIIIINSYNTNFLLEVSENIILINNKKIIIEGNKYEILSNKNLLDKINLKVPNVINFINKTKELKNIKLGYRDNINDLIKDIYRYAK